MKPPDKESIKCIKLNYVGISLLWFSTGQSPTRRNTVSAVGKSPPPGFHSWLKAKNLSVVNNADPGIPSIQNISSALATVTASPSASATVPSEGKTPAEKTRIQVDLTRDDTPVASDKETVEVGEAGIEINGLVALSPHFESKMKPVDGYVPLSVFNTMWLKQELMKYSLRNKKDKKEDEKYTGLAIPDEWKMSFGEWVTAFDLFVTYLRHYKHNDLADKFLIHRENVLAIKRERVSWIMAFRYDQAIRTTVMTFRNRDGKLANPAVRDENQEREARNETERLGDLLPRWAEINPYSDGQPKSHINPISGEVMNYNNHNNYTMATSSGNGFHPTHHSKPNARSWQHANQHSNQPVYDGPGSSSYHNYEDRRNFGRNVRGRGRGSGWVLHGCDGRDGRDDRGGGGRENDYYDNRRGEGSNSWRREDRREDRKGDTNGPKYGSGGKAK